MVLSLKENIEMVKEELNSEEKFFENAVKTERFVKKYKNMLISGVVGVVVIVVALALYNANKEAKVEAANKAFSALQKDATDKQAAAELQQVNPALFDVWQLSNAIAKSDISVLKILSKSKTLVVSDLASYELAALNSDTKLLENYAYQQNAIYKDLALVESAVLLMEKNELEAAHQKLQSITSDSSMYGVSRMLLHYGVK